MGILQNWNEPVKLILSTYLPFKLGSNFSLLQREEGRKEHGLKIGKMESSRTEKSLLSWFCPPIYPSYLGLPFLITAEREGKKEQGLKIGKRESSKTEMILLSWFCTPICPSYWAPISHYFRERREEGTGAENRKKGILQNWNEPVKLIWYTYLPFILGSHFSLLHRGKGKRNRGWK